MEILKSSSDIYVSTLHTLVNNYLNNAEVPVKLKIVDIQHQFSKKEILLKQNIVDK